MNQNPLQPQNAFTPPAPAGPTAPGVDGISLAEFLQILRRRRAVILQSLVLVTVVAVVLTLMTKPVYRASARLLVENASISYNAIDTSESRRQALEAQNERSGPVFKIKNDPRVTRVGAVLRRYSLDELPQILNVLKGDMSLVGPRPALPREVAHYTIEQRGRLAVTPGVTGLWQVSGRARLSFEESVALDLHYIEHQSLALNLSILLKTLPAVLRGDGAY